MGFDLNTRALLAAFTFLCTLTFAVQGSCRFPQFLQKTDPWVGDYKDGKMVAYVKPNLITLNEGNIKMTRECVQQVREKYLILHKEDSLAKYLCMQFIQRGDYIVQIKTSDMFMRQSVDICDESGMTIEPYPLVYSGQTPEGSISCPFTGGYNVYAYFPHPNNSAVCNNLLLLMRLESECDQGEGIMFDFRRVECVPRDLPQKQVQRAHCVAHWTQDNFTFIILQHAEMHTRWFCLRTSDPLHNIKSAYLWLKVICDTSEKPSLEVSQNYMRLELSKRIFSSTCADELELCPEMPHYCSMSYSRHCAHTCGLCLSESQIGECTFDEQYRGRWVESSAQADTTFDIQAYSLLFDHPGKYDCIDLDSAKMTDKRVLLELYTNGCFPRYACAEIEKVTSSVLKFRLGNRLTWPLSSLKNQKEEICKMENFKPREKHGSKNVKDRPPRLLVNTGNIKEIHCGLPERLQNGIAFREDGKNCGGCLNYEPHISANHFTISPVNCSIETSDSKGYKNIPIQYACLATMEFYNNTYSVVTKTINFSNGLGQYLVWIFTSENQIKVLKAGDTYMFKQSQNLKSDLIQVQFTILRNDKLQCRNFFFLPRSTTSSAMQRRKPVDNRYIGGDYLNGERANIKDDYTGPTVHGDDYLPYSPGTEGESQLKGVNNDPRFDNSKGEHINEMNSSTCIAFWYANSLFCAVTMATLVAFISGTHQHGVR